MTVTDTNSDRHKQHMRVMMVMKHLESYNYTCTQIPPQLLPEHASIVMSFIYDIRW